MSQAPAFQLYAADFYMDTLTWETDDIGVYFCLLMAEWVNGPLDNNTRTLAKIAKKTHQKFIKNWTKISQKFVETDTGTLINLRLEEEREKQLNYREKQSIKGKRSAELRSTTVATTVQPLYQPEGNSSVFSLQSSIKDLNTFATFFTEWWQVYPLRNGKRVGRKDCLNYLKGIKLQNGDRELLIKATINYSQSQQVTQGFCKDPIRFLRKDFWRDWIEPEKPQQPLQPIGKTDKIIDWDKIERGEA
jgi:uncharacterized protein YdaU (DUF1376 family)